MQVELGAKVSTADGKQIGTIDKLILDPESGEVKAIVVQKGLLFKDDIEIDLDGIVDQAQGAVRVRYTEQQLDDLPRFYAGSYTPPPPERSAAYADIWGYPATTFLWPARGTASADTDLYGHEAVGEVADEVRVMQQERDLGNAVIEEGSEVRSRDGEKVGTIHRIVFDASNGEPSAIVIRKGFLFTEDVELPASLIASAADDVVYLTVDQHEARQRIGKQAVHPPVI